MCHLRFSPAGSVLCESQVMALGASPGQTAYLHADALDLWPGDYCWSTNRCPGEVRVGLHGQVLAPVDPDLQIERDYLFGAIAWTIMSISALVLVYLRFRRGGISGRRGNRAAS